MPNIMLMGARSDSNILFHNKLGEISAIFII